jgi:N-acetylmuramoyl-L-alanine amidase
MAYELHEEFNSKNYTPGNQADSVWHVGPRVVEYITIHWWGSKGQNFWDVTNYLCVNNKPTSAHFVAQAKLVACIVNPDDAAWHAGHPVGNTKTIGIECRPEGTDGDYQTVAELIAYLRGIYGDVPLKPHQYWQNTACPGEWNLARLDQLARSIKNPSMPAPVPAAPVQLPTVTPTAKWERDPHWVVDPGDTLSKIAAHYGVTVERLAAYNGIKNVNAIKVGEFIWPPVGRDTWIVDPGDTLTKIAAFYGASMSVKDIAYSNGLNDPNKLTVGVRLNIP